jgi:hypothetical protein
MCDVQFVTFLRLWSIEHSHAESSAFVLLTKNLHIAAGWSRLLHDRLYIAYQPSIDYVLE